MLCSSRTTEHHLRQLRIEHARRALVTTAKTVAEIALDCGFYDQSHLCRAFREIQGTSPVSYRRATRGRRSLRSS